MMTYRELMHKLLDLSTIQLESPVLLRTTHGLQPATLEYSDEDNDPNCPTDSPILEY